MKKGYTTKSLLRSVLLRTRLSASEMQLIPHQRGKLRRFAQHLGKAFSPHKTTSEPLVSIIMIFWNAEKFMEEAIKSVLSQTYRNWELLLVDDGSIDRSTEIARMYTERFPRKIRYLEHEGHQNKGMSASRNLGIAHAREEFIAFLDSDDVWFPDKLEKQIKIMEQYPDIALIFNPIIHVYDDGARLPQPATLSPGKQLPGAWFLKMLESDDNGACPSTVLMRKGIALAVGGFEESFRGMFQLFEDQAMWSKISLNASIYYAPEPAALYRIHSASWWGRSSYFEQQFARMHLYAWLIKYIRSHNRDKFQSELIAAKVRFYLTLVRYLVDMNQIDTAAALVQCLERQVPDQPEDAEWNYLAAFSRHQSRIELPEALDRYDRALRHGFDEFWVRYNRGDLHAELGNLDQAREDLERAVELKHDHEGAQLMLQQLTPKNQD